LIVREGVIETMIEDEQYEEAFLNAFMDASSLKKL